MSDELNVDLKPCPFCGKHELKKETFLDLIGWVYRVQCEYCGNVCPVNQGSLTDMEDAIKAWNTRPLEEEKDKEIARLKEVLVKIKALSTAHVGSLVLYQQEMKAINGYCKIALGKDTDVPAKDTEKTKEVKND